MYQQINAEQALQQIQQDRESAIYQVYRDQVAAYSGEALAALHEVIQPWWQRFLGSPDAARISWLINSRKLVKPTISQPVRYLRHDDRIWTAIFQIENKTPRELKLIAAQYPYREQYGLNESLKPRSWSGAMLAHNQRRTIPTDKLNTYTLDLHPIVLIDFANQIDTHIVQVAIENCIRQGEQRPPAAYAEY